MKNRMFHETCDKLTTKTQTHTDTHRRTRTHKETQKQIKRHKDTQRHRHTQLVYTSNIPYILSTHTLTNTQIYRRIDSYMRTRISSIVYTYEHIIIITHIDYTYANALLYRARAYIPY